MPVKRITVDIGAGNVAQVVQFYKDVFDLNVLMDQGWVVTLGSDEPTNPQITIASQGGSNAPMPDMSIEVTDLQTALARARKMGLTIEYGPVDEPWGVQRFFIRDPADKLINVLMHMT